MEKHILQPLTKRDQIFAERNHNLIYEFIYNNGHSIEEHYNIAVMGYLKAVQIYRKREDLQSKYHFAFIAHQYMRSEMGNHFKTQNSQCRKSEHGTISLDADFSEMENLYNSIGGKSVEADVMEKELLNDIAENLSEVQRKIVQLKMTGYSNKETYLLMEIKPSTYYNELKRIRAIVEHILHG